ncbi:MAG: HK97 family phage prohead protease [Candidatus Ornithomonoglobus sp.]
MQKERFKGIQHRAFEVEADGIRVIDEEKRIVELSFSSETPVKRWGAFEILSHKSGAVMLERINTSGCLLFNHNRDVVIGKVLKAEIKNKRGIARVQFDDDETSVIYYNKVKNGTLRNTSVGYNVHEAKRDVTGKGENLRINEIATLWEPLEISIVSIPADYTVGVGRDAADTDTVKTGHLELCERQLQLNKNHISCAKEV